MTEHDRPVDVERIAFVARRFHELRGLPGITFGCGLVLAAALTPAFDVNHVSSLQFMMLAMMVGNAFIAPIEHWYRRTFGEMVVPPAAEFGAVLPTLGIMLGVFFDLFLQTTGRQIPSVAAAVVGTYAFVVLVRDGWRRPYYVLALAAGVAGTLVTATAPAGPPGSMTPMLPARAQAFLLAYTWAGLSHAIAAYFDHRLLAATLTPRLSGEPQQDRGIRGVSNGRLRAQVAGFVFVGSVISLALGPETAASVMVLIPSFAFLVAQILLLSWRRFAARRGMDRQAIARARLEQQAAVVGDGAHAIWLMVAAAAAVDSWWLPHGRFVLLPLALAVWSAWVAIRDWPDRRHYLIGTVALAACPLAAAGVATFHGLPLLLAVTSGSLLVEGLLDHRLFQRRSTVTGESPEPSPQRS